MRFRCLFALFIGLAACSVDRSGLGDPLGTDLGGVGPDLGGAVDAGGPGRDGGPPPPADLGPPDLGRPDSGPPDLGPPDLGCGVNGCGSPSMCLVDGTCGACTPGGSVCCPSCGSGLTCMAGACVTVGGSCGGVGEPCCASLSPCMGHADCDLLGGAICVHCGDRGEGCCGGVTCYGGTSCGIDSSFSFVCS